MKFEKEKMIGFWVTHLGMAFRSEIDECMSELGLAGPDGMILVLLHAEGSSSLLELARHAHHAHPTVLRNLDSLEESGLIVRTVDEKDRRKKVIQLTAEGRKLIPTIQKKIRKLNQRAIKGFDSDEEKKLISFMRRLAVNIDAKHLCGELVEGEDE